MASSETGLRTDKLHAKFRARAVELEECDINELAWHAACLEATASDHQAALAEAREAGIRAMAVKLSNLYGPPLCENLHHPNKWLHKSGEPCPVEAAIEALLSEDPQ